MQGTAPELKFHHVRAGAGAGKTRGLVEKVVEIFRTRQLAQLPTRLVVTTFTRKATQSLKKDSRSTLVASKIRRFCNS